MISRIPENFWEFLFQILKSYICWASGNTSMELRLDSSSLLLHPCDRCLCLQTIQSKLSWASWRQHPDSGGLPDSTMILQWAIELPLISPLLVKSMSAGGKTGSGAFCHPALCSLSQMSVGGQTWPLEDLEEPCC